jgi:hypothetical protein
MTRNRLAYLGLLAVTIVAGLASRRYGEYLPAILQKNAGDALWAVAVFLLLAILFPRASTVWLAAWSLAISYLDELTQLYHAPWIDLLRENRVGALFLGWGFLWSDLVCYTTGIAVVAALETVKMRRPPALLKEPAR